MTDPTVTERDIYITRSFAAPRSVVWKFWTERERIAQWFGPTDFHIPLDSVTIDLRVGGAWSLAMADADDNRFPITGTIVELVDEELLVVELDAATDMGQLENVLLRVQFHDHGDTTRVTLHQGPLPIEAQDVTRQGWELSFEKLDSIFSGASA